MVTKWPRRSGANRAFGSYARLGEITERKVELLVDHRIIVALQNHPRKLRTPPQLDARLHRHRRRRLHDGRRRERQPRITFGMVTEGYETPWVFTSTLKDSPRLRRKVHHAMRERRVLKQSSGELMDWHFVPKLSEFPWPGHE